MLSSYFICRTTIYTQYTVLCEYHADVRNQIFSSILTNNQYRFVWYSFISLLDVDYKNGFLCRWLHLSLEPYWLYMHIYNYNLLMRLVCVEQILMSLSWMQRLWHSEKICLLGKHFLRSLLRLIEELEDKYDFILFDMK